MLLRYIKEVQHAIVAHYSQPAIPLVERNRFDPFVNFDLGEAELTVEILADYFEEGKPIAQIASEGIEALDKDSL